MLKKLLSFNSSRYRLYEENKAFAESMPVGSLVLDAGCGEAPYKELFTKMKYESADFAQSDRPYADDITYICDLKNIPVRASRYDYIILNQVLEHIPEPQLVISELARILKPGGKIFCTAPLFYQEHEQPYDFYRYTQFAWKLMLTKAGLLPESIAPMEGFFGQCGYFFEVMYYNLPTSPKKIKGKTGRLAAPFLYILRPFLGIGAVLFHRLEKHAKIDVGIGPKNYAVIASKPAKK